MSLLEKQLFTKKSQLPNAGKGLFTKKFIPKGSRIVEYTGRVSTWKDVEDKDSVGENMYIFYVTRNRVIDAAPYKKVLARYANDARGLTRIKGINNNAEYEIVKGRVYIDAKKDIPAGSEIFVDYGREYWQVIRHNMKVEKKKEKEKTRKNKK